MSYYGGTVTTEGRGMITGLLVGDTIEFTRIIVGSGAVPAGMHPMDMTGLVNPIAEGTSSTPIVENSVLTMVVEYRNDLNGGLAESFWLREFGIYAKANDGVEKLFYYATLGDSPQPVNAFVDNRVDIRRYPISITFDVDANIQVTYNPGAFMTSAEAEKLIEAMVNTAIGNVGSAVITTVVIPATGWTPVDDLTAMDGFQMYIDVVCPEAGASHFPSVALDKASLDLASAAGLCPTMEALDGVLRFWANVEPTADMTGTVALLSSGGTGGGGGASTGGGSSSYVLPVATSTVLGGVRVKNDSGLKIDTSGFLSVDAATDTQTSDAIDDAFNP